MIVIWCGPFAASLMLGLQAAAQLNCYTLEFSLWTHPRKYHSTARTSRSYIQIGLRIEAGGVAMPLLLLSPSRWLVLPFCGSFHINGSSVSLSCLVGSIRYARH